MLPEGQNIMDLCNLHLVEVGGMLLGVLINIHLESADNKCLPLLNDRIIHDYFQASNGQWYQMNDSLVHSSNIKVVLNQQAYVLFYLR